LAEENIHVGVAVERGPASTEGERAIQREIQVSITYRQTLPHMDTHREPVAIPRRLGGVSGQRTMRAMVVDELLRSENRVCT
jgi:hypothetical protein